MTFGGDKDIWGLIGNLQQEQADELMKFALEAGINFIDTANGASLRLSKIAPGDFVSPASLPRTRPKSQGPR